VSHNQQLSLIKSVTEQLRATEQPHLWLPGERTNNSLTLPEELSRPDWIAVGRTLSEIEGAVAWWIGDWWAFGSGRKWGEGPALAEAAGINYGTARQYGWVSDGFHLSSRLDNLSFKHHQEAMAAPAAERQWWLEQALTAKDKDGNSKPWSANQLRAAIKQGKAFQRTRSVEFDAEKLGKFVVLYADPPWQYENPPMGGSNRSIENHYPTMTLEQICAMPVAGIANDNCVLFLWATSPKLSECMKVIDAWGFNYRTDMVWVKDKIGMGYHVREQHESLLIAKRGELPPPAVEARPSSVISAPRLEHSAKPETFYDIIDKMYPDVRKKELFGRSPQSRPLWSNWGNQ
jgi:N6-adenosine-specific RNA methylase IME4